MEGSDCGLILRSHPSVCLEGRRKTQKSMGYPARYLNPETGMRNVEERSNKY
jgi:hypothetical protein